MTIAMPDASDTLVTLPALWRDRAWQPAAGHTLLRLDAAARQATLCQDGRELRFTVAGGDLVLLLHMALALHGDVPDLCWPDPDQPPGVTRAPDIVLSARDGAAGAAASVVEAGLHHLLANVRAGLAGNVEGIHQLRVAIRRLRTALSLFEPHLDTGTTVLLQQGLRGMGRVLGAARDWDVFCLEVLPGIPEAAIGGDHRRALQDEAGSRRRDAHAQMVREMDDTAILSLVQCVTAWTGTVAPGKGSPATRLKQVAPALLSRLERKVQRRGRHIERRSDEELHALRRAAKQLRYGIEYLRPLFKAKAVKDYLHACEALQESLGEMNDTATAIGLTAELADGTPALASAADALAQVLRSRAEDTVRHVHDGWRRFGRIAPFWT